MHQQPTFFRSYDLAQARHVPSRREPAAHQSEALRNLHAWFQNAPSPRGGLLVLPTGGGKTFTAIRFLCEGPLSKGYKVLWLAHTHHLLEQAFFSFGPKSEVDGQRQGYEIGHIAEPKSTLHMRVVSGTIGHHRVHDIGPADDVVICTLPTATRAFTNRRHPRLDAFLKAAGDRLVVVFDEAHHLPAYSYRTLVGGLLAEHPNLYLLGLTATPTYTDEQKRGWLNRMFPQQIIYQVSPEKLMATGILSKPIPEQHQTLFVPEIDERELSRWLGTYRDIPEQIIGQLAQSRERNDFIVETYVSNRQRYGKTIMFVDRWFQCDYLREALRRHGVKADVIYSHIDADPGSAAARSRRSADENKHVLDRFRDGELDVLINVRMLTEGTDVPLVQTVFLTRQTTSQILLTQMIGRALRGPQFGGTPEAHIVAFIDNWKHLINWAEFEGFSATPPPADDVRTTSERPPWHLVSIDLVRRLADAMYSLTEIPGELPPFLSLIPIGWYQVEFEALVQGAAEQPQDNGLDANEPIEGSNEIVRQLVLVYDNDYMSYEQLITALHTAPLQAFVGQDITLEEQRTMLENWRDRFFEATSERIGNDLLQKILLVTRHMAQNENTPPTFFHFDARDEHNLDTIAKRHIDADVGLRVVNELLLQEYQREDRYWRTIYPSYGVFRMHYDSCVRRLLEQPSHDLLVQPIIDEQASSDAGEPSEDLKAVVKARDGYRCLCCGETNQRRLQIDHIVPRYNGGTNEVENLQTLCRLCNQIKGIDLINFREHRATLDRQPDTFPSLRIAESEQESTGGWEQYLRRSINFYYRCSAVKSVRFDTQPYRVRLYTGNNPVWLDPYLSEMLAKIRQVA
jgi:ATP-dependent helicase IRC3